MKTYQVVLTRGYLVSVKAESENKAMRFAEHYLGNCIDCSDEEEQVRNNFSIEEIEMTYNEAHEVTEITD